MLYLPCLYVTKSPPYTLNPFSAGTVYIRQILTFVYDDFKLKESLLSLWFIQEYFGVVSVKKLFDYAVLMGKYNIRSAVPTSWICK